MFDKNLDKNLDKYFNEKTNNSPFVVDMLNLGNNSTDLMKVDKHENKNLLKGVFEIDDQYKFIKDDIIDSFQKVFQDYNDVYTPYKKTKNIYVKYLLDKLYNNDSVPKELYNHFNNSLTNLEFKNKKIPVDYNDDGQMLLKGGSVNNYIKINYKDLGIGILRVRYSNNRKLTNNLLKDDYKISKRTVNAIKFNKDIHKLSSNEKKFYYEFQKFLNKQQDINVSIGSYI